MKKSVAALLCTFALLHLTRMESRGNVVGYFNQVWPNDGYILINNPLDNGTNTLSSLFEYAPVGIMVQLWDSTANGYTTPTTKETYGWDGTDYTLFPGTGARVYSPVSYTNTYVGEALTSYGEIPYWGGGDGPIPPPPFSGPNGTYLLGTITPIDYVEGEHVFLWTLGRGPNVGEQFSTLTYTTTCLGGGNWDNGTPSLSLGESAFFTIPEPTAFTLLGLGSLALLALRRRR